MKEIIRVILLVVFVVLLACLGFSIAACIAESDMSPWLKAWLLFGR